MTMTTAEPSMGEPTPEAAAKAAAVMTEKEAAEAKAADEAKVAHDNSAQRHLVGIFCGALGFLTFIVAVVWAEYSIHDVIDRLTK